MVFKLAISALVLSLAASHAADVMTAAEGADRSDRGRTIHGTFSMTVRSTGGDHDILFLNSESNFRDPHNLSPSLTPAAVGELKKLYGSDLASFFTGRQIWVTGDARRMLFVFTHDGNFIHRGYFQHRIEVTRASQISLAPPG